MNALQARALRGLPGFGPTLGHGKSQLHRQPGGDGVKRRLQVRSARAGRNWQTRVRPPARRTILTARE